MTVTMIKTVRESDNAKYAETKCRGVRKILFYSDGNTSWIRFKDRNGKVVEAPLFECDICVDEAV